MFKKILLLLLITPVVLFLIASKDRRASDEAVLKNANPSQEIANIAEKVSFNDTGKATFYRANPEFVTQDEFVKHCRKNKNIELSLGCIIGYTPGRSPFSPQKIFLLKIEDEEYQDHKYSASVHEAMHLAYWLLPSAEKETLNPILEKEFQARQDDVHLTSNMTMLKDAGGEYLEELHSVFAVEYSDLSPELETYYSKYFVDRTIIVDLYQNGSLETKIRSFESLNAQAATLNSQLLNLQSQLQGHQNAGNITAYNNLLPQFNNQVNVYNAKLAQSKSLFKDIEQFYLLFNPNYKTPQPAN